MSLYGISFAAELLEKGRYQEALAAASTAIDQDGANPEAWFERGQALAALDRRPEALSDLEKALVLDQTAAVLDSDFLDDTYFETLLDLARNESVDAGVQRLAHYAQIFPQGRHVADAQQWQQRLRGELKSEFVKRTIDE